MERAAFEGIIKEAGGADYVIGLRFKNGYKVVYSKHTINIEEDLLNIGGMDFIRYEHYGTNGKVVSKSYLALDELCQVYTIVDLDTTGLRLREFME